MIQRIPRAAACIAVVGLTALAAWTSSVSVSGQGARAGAAPLQVSGLPGAEAVKAFVAARMQKNWTAPKTPWGDPDIQGIFTSKDEANTPFERPDQWAGRRMEDITPKEFAEAIAERQQLAVERAPFAGGGEAEGGVAIAVPIHWFDNLAARNSRPWFVMDPPDGKVPALAPTARRVPPLGPHGGERNTYLDRDAGDRCISFAFRMPSIYGNSYQIVQTPEYVVLRREQLHDARMIPLDGRSVPSVRSYEGHSRARWDGNTLVVETTNFDERVEYRGFPATNLRVIERFTRISPKQVEWSMTIDDPTVYVRPWTYSYPLTEDNSQPIHEYACHEGNFGIANILTAGRAAENK